MQLLISCVHTQLPMPIIDFIGRSAKPVVACTAACFVVFSSSWEPLYYIALSLCNALLSKALKRLLRVPRPPSNQQDISVSCQPMTTYGMPSSHAQTLAFFLAVSTRLVLHAPTAADASAAAAPTIDSDVTYAATMRSMWHSQPSILSMPMPPRESPVTPQQLLKVALLCMYAFCAALWRVHTGLHTLLQTGVGGFIGCVTGTYAHYYSAVLLSSDFYNVFGTTKPVPMALKAAVCLLGALILYYQEMKAMRSQQKQEKKQK